MLKRKLGAHELATAIAYSCPKRGAIPYILPVQYVDVASAYGERLHEELTGESAGNFREFEGDVAMRVHGKFVPLEKPLAIEVETRYKFRGRPFRKEQKAADIISGYKREYLEWRTNSLLLHSNIAGTPDFIFSGNGHEKIVELKSGKLTKPLHIWQSKIYLYLAEHTLSGEIEAELLYETGRKEPVTIERDDRLIIELYADRVRKMIAGSYKNFNDFRLKESHCRSVGCKKLPLCHGSDNDPALISLKRGEKISL